MWIRRHPAFITVPTDAYPKRFTGQAIDIRERKLSISLKDYIELAEWTGKSIIHPDKAAIPQHLAPVLDWLNLQKHHRLKQIENYGSTYNRVVGHVELIRQKAAQLNKRWLQGISAARLMHQPTR